MVKIRLQRIGARKQPKYRVVVADEQTKRSGKVIEILGNYDPNPPQLQLTIEKEKYAHWISKGAQPTDAVRNLFKRYERTSRVSS